MDEFEKNEVQQNVPEPSLEPQPEMVAEIEIEKPVEVNVDEEPVKPDDNTEACEQPDAPTPPKAEEIPLEPFDYSDYVAKEKEPMSKGLKVFCVILACIIALSAACTGGYFLGRKSVLTINKKHTEIELSARPKKTDEMTAAEVYEKTNKSIVGIRTYNSTGNYSDASGVVYSKDGYIVTNDHIYGEVGAPKFKVYTYDGKEYDAKYVAGDTVSDLAVIKVDTTDLEPATFGNSDELFCGENVVAIGRPSDATSASSITKGIISSPKHREQITSSYSSSLIQTDSAINPGSSGGALLNMYGQVIGITSSKLAGVVYDSVGFAIPTTTMKRVCEQLIKDKKVTDRAKLGITYTEVSSVTAEVQNISSTGLYIVSVSDDSDLYGKVEEGDVITQINGINITCDDVVLDVIDKSYAGDTIKLTILGKNGGTNEYSVKLMSNTSESSYSETITEEKDDGIIIDGNGQNNGNNKDENSKNDNDGSGTFNFPFGY